MNAGKDWNQTRTKIPAKSITESTKKEKRKEKKDNLTEFFLQNMTNTVDEAEKIKTRRVNEIM